ncbi:MAG TPA: hypothetical protein DIW46_10165 [Microbacterium sp.]|nr:hypothetical protein [Microbacterium sp.]
MSRTITDRKYLNKAVRSRTSWLVFLLVAAIGAGTLGYFNVTGVVKELNETYTSTTGEVVSEGSIRVLTGTRRSRHYEDRRTVHIEYAIDGVPGSGSAVDEDLQIGESLTIWVNERNLDVEIEEPTGPEFWDWAWAIAMPILALLLLWGFVYSVRTSIRLKRFTPEGREPDFVFALQNIEVQAGKGRKAKQRTFIFHGVMQSNSIPKRVGEKATISAVEKTLPPAQTYPPTFTGYYLKPGKEGAEPVLHAPELDAWWPATLAFPSDLEMVSTQAEKPKKTD